MSFSNFSLVHPFHLAWKDLPIARTLRSEIWKFLEDSVFVSARISMHRIFCEFKGSKSLETTGCVSTKKASQVLGAKNDSAKFPNMATLFLWPLTHPHFEEAAGRPPSYEATFNRSLGMWKLHFSVTTSGTSLWKSTAMAAPACASIRVVQHLTKTGE